jgi:hypothetical protein
MCGRSCIWLLLASVLVSSSTAQGHASSAKFLEITESNSHLLNRLGEYAVSPINHLR